MTQLQRVPIGDLASPFKRVRFFAAQRFIPDQNGQINPIDGDFALQNGQQIALSSGAKFQQLLDSTALENYVTELRADIYNSTAAEIEITLTPPYYDAIQIIEKRLIRRDSLILAQWGYSSSSGLSDHLSRPFLFNALDPKIDINSTDITITIRGMDVLGMALSRNEQRRRWDRNGDYASDLSIVEELARRQGLILDLTELPPTNSLYENKFEPEAVEQVRNDWLFFQDLLERNNAGFYSEGNRVVLYDEEDAKQQDAFYRLRFMNQMQDEYDIPMESFSANPIGWFFASPETKSVCSRITDMDNNEITESVYDAQTEAGLGHEEGHSQAGDLGTDEVVTTPAGNVKPYPPTERNAAGTHVSIPENHPDREELARQIMRVGAVKANMTAKVTAVGVPYIVPHLMMLVDCGIPSFSGKYYVNKVSHSIGLSGYDMELDLIRAAVKEPSGNTSVPVGQKNLTSQKSANIQPAEQTEVQP